MHQISDTPRQRHLGQPRATFTRRRGVVHPHISPTAQIRRLTKYNILVKTRQIMNKQFSTACGTSKGKSRSVAVFAAAALSFFLVQSVARADGEYYGTVESFGDGAVVIKTTKHSTGHWKVDDTTKVTSPVKEADWVFVKVETSGHVTNLRFEERPTIHSGVIQKIHDNVLTVHSGPNLEDWNLKETTIMSGIARGPGGRR